MICLLSTGAAGTEHLASACEPWLRVQSEYDIALACHFVHLDTLDQDPEFVSQRDVSFSMLVEMRAGGPRIQAGLKPKRH